MKIVRVLFLGLIFCCLLAALGCTSGIKLRNSQTGQTATCGPYHVAPNMGFTAQMAMERERQCLEDFGRQGFIRVPD